MTQPYLDECEDINIVAGFHNSDIIFLYLLHMPLFLNLLSRPHRLGTNVAHAPNSALIQHDIHNQPVARLARRPIAQVAHVSLHQKDHRPLHPSCQTSLMPP